MDFQSEVDLCSDLLTCNMNIHTQKLNMKKIEDEIAELEKSYRDEDSAVNFCAVDLDCIENELTGCIALGEASSMKLLEVDSDMSRIEAELSKEKRRYEKKASKMADKKVLFLKSRQEGEEKLQHLKNVVSKGDSYDKMLTLEKTLADEQACAVTVVSILNESLNKKKTFKEDIVNLSSQSSQLIITAAQISLQLRKLKGDNKKSSDLLSSPSNQFSHNWKPKTFQRFPLYQKENRGGNSFLERLRQQQSSVTVRPSPTPAKTMPLTLPFQRRTQFNIPSRILSPNISTVHGKGLKINSEETKQANSVEINQSNPGGTNICEESQQERTFPDSEPLVKKTLPLRSQLSLPTSKALRNELPRIQMKTGTSGETFKSMFAQSSTVRKASEPERDSLAIVKKPFTFAASQAEDLFPKLPISTSTENDDIFSAFAGNTNNLVGFGGQSFLGAGSNTENGGGDGFDFDNMFNCGSGSDKFLF